MEIESCFTTFVKLIHDVRFFFINCKKMEGGERPSLNTSVTAPGKGECSSFYLMG